MAAGIPIQDTIKQKIIGIAANTISILNAFSVLISTSCFCFCVFIYTVSQEIDWLSNISFNQSD